MVEMMATVETRSNTSDDFEPAICYGLEEYNNLLNSFKPSPTPAAPPSNYPGYYGGAYVNDDGKLVILISGNPKVHRDEFVRRCASEDIVLEKCKFPYVVLLNQARKIIEYQDNNINNNIMGYGIKETENCIYIDLKEYDDEKIKEFKRNVSSAPYFRFKKGSYVNFEQGTTYDLFPGDYIFNPSLVPSSFGYRARIANDATKVGMIVAGHSFKLNDNLIYNSVVVGKCTKRSFDNSKADASFIEITNKLYIPTNNISCGGILSTINKSVPEGGSVNLCGSSSFSQTGKVLFTNRQVKTIRDGVEYTINDVVEADYTSAPGDSGGLIYTVSGGLRYTTGIHTGRGGENNNAFYSKSDNVNLELGVVRY